MAIDRINATALLDGGVTTADIADDAVTSAKLDTNIAVSGTFSSGGAMTATGELKANGGVVFNEDSADLDFRVESNGNANMLVVDGGNDRVGIGTGSPTTALTLGTSQTATVQNGGSTSAPAYGITSGALGVNGTYVPAANTLGFVVGGAERGRFTANGLTFNGDTAAVNALDDYEEGTWTPAVSTASSHVVQTGIYTKIGNLVTIQCVIQFVQSGSVFGSVSGLPFTVAGVNYSGITFREWYSTGVTLSGNLTIGALSTSGFWNYANSSAATNGQTYGYAFSISYRT